MNRLVRLPFSLHCLRAAIDADSKAIATGVVGSGRHQVRTLQLQHLLTLRDLAEA